MGIKYNELTFKGTASGSFPFGVAVSENDGINVVTDNSELIEFDNRTGAVKRINRNRKIVKKNFLFEIMSNEQSALDVVKKWLSGEGWLVTSDNLNRQQWCYKIESYSAKLTQVNTYELEVEFYCHPYSYSVSPKTATSSGNKIIFNLSGSTEIWPKFEFRAVSNLTMFALTHPNGRSIQVGKQGGNIVIPAGSTCIINTEDCSVTVNGVRKYPVPMSRGFYVEPGTTEIGITTNTGATMPTVKSEYREGYL